ncbi:MAG TPA: lipase maturation factor family protein, partial [Vicinamibacterales bacterium]|nr:lipase maturation factor family protein [Vicinamibacterales bacterium]
MTAEIVWGVFTRLLALVYVVAFVSLRYEILAWAGVRGVNPLAQKLARMREGLGTWRAVTRHPSLFWISASDAMLRALPLAGAAAAILAACGILSPAMLAIAWVLYLSLDPAFGLSYPWESLLLEAGFLAIFLPPLAPLPAWTMTSAPQPILMLAMHWLLFRLMFGFGKTKFTRQALGDPLYLRSFLISQPMPSPLGWRAIRLPRPLLAGSLALLFVTEIILPFFVFVPGWPRWLAAGG